MFFCLFVLHYLYLLFLSFETEFEPWQRQPFNTDNNLIDDLDKSEYMTRENDVSQMSILDMPNIERDQFEYVEAVGENSRVRKSLTTPEPIIEIYSDSEDTSFDDFEKNIYNEISRRALIKNQLMSRKQKNQIIYSDGVTDGELSHLKVHLNVTLVNMFILH